MTIHRAKITSKGQTTIPVEIRRLWKLEAGSELEFYEDYRGQLQIRVCNANSLNFLKGLTPRNRLPEFSTDDDALAADVNTRNAAPNNKHIAS